MTKEIPQPQPENSYRTSREPLSPPPLETPAPVKSPEELASEEAAREWVRHFIERAKEKTRRTGQEASARFDANLAYRRAMDEENRRKRNPIQTFFKRKFIGFVSRTVVEALPFPIVGYGPGDVITGISTIKGKDILTGDKLDLPDRIIYGVATAIPYLPATILVEPAKILRRKSEDIIDSFRRR